MTVLRHLDPPVDWDELPPGAELAAIDAGRAGGVRARAASTPPTPCCSARPTAPRPAWPTCGGGAGRTPTCGRSAGGPGYRSPLARPEGIDYVIVRENLEDAYVGIMGDVADLLRRRPGRPAGPPRQRGRGPLRGEGHHPGRHRAGGPLLLRAGPAPAGAGPPGQAHRVGQDEHAAARPTAGSATSWPRSAATTPTSSSSTFIVDDMAHRLVLRPHDLDVLLLPNLYGDVLSDEGAATIGGLGLAPVGLLRRRLRLLRVGPRHRARHRRPGPHQPDGHAAQRGDAARPPRASATTPPASTPPSPPSTPPARCCPSTRAARRGTTEFAEAVIAALG